MLLNQVGKVLKVRLDMGPLVRQALPIQTPKQNNVFSKHENNNLIMSLLIFLLRYVL